MTLLELFELLKRNLKVVIIAPIVFGVATALFMITRPDTYTASTTMYVLSGKGDEASSLTSQDLNVAQQITKDVSILAESARVRREVAEKLGRQNISGNTVRVVNQNNTRVITLSVTGTDAYDVANIANAYGETISSVASEIMGVEAVNVIDQANVPQSKSGPPRTRNTLIGVAAGLFAGIAYVVLKDALNTRVSDSKEVEALLEIPVVGHFPYIEGGV